MSIFWACVLVIVLLAGWVLNVFGLPGNWTSLAAVALYAYLIPSGHRVWVSWWIVGAVLVLAILGEVVETFASAAGAAKVGGSRRGAVLAIIGSFIGGIVGVFVGIPVPVVGSLLGVILFASAGALGGAMLGEYWKGRDWDTTWQVGQAAFWGRMLGTVGKIVLGSVIVVLVLFALVWK
jgi:uncharacterized protein YqgC (DUF456 family)